MVTSNDIVGQDHGYLYFKDNLRNIFKSAYSRTNNTLTDDRKIVINNETFYFGSGTPTADTDKCNSKVFMVSTLADLSIRNTNEAFIVAGLPITQYLTTKDKLIDTIMQYNNCVVQYQNHYYKPNIKDVSVFAQGVGAMFGIGLDDGKYICFDIGSYTINVILVQMKNNVPHIIKFDTWFDGILTLYNKIIKEIFDKCDNTIITIDDVEDILTNGLNVRGEQMNIDFLKPVIRDYLENIFAKFKPNYPYDIYPILFVGGGSIFLGNILINCFNNSMILPDAQFANANGYYNFGLQKYGYLLEGGCKYA
jgi:plasmid segregation protein ParM